MGQVTYAFDGTGSWQELKDDHFIVYFQPDDRFFARSVLRESEQYYDKIGYQIGASNYNKFWTWDNRVQIYIYSSQKAFADKTGQQKWSRGGAIHKNPFSGKKVILTFAQDKSFLDNVLPHEIAHLILRDFIGETTVIPLWFEEGVAQIQEVVKKEAASRIIPKLVRLNQQWTIDQMQTMDINKVDDSLAAAIFYIQSFSLIDFSGWPDQIFRLNAESP